MSDLFDQVAMLALGSEANLRPRPRTRFEPMMASEITSRLGLAPMPDEPLPVEDDPLAAGAAPSGPPSRQAARRTELHRVEPGGSRPAERPDITPRPGAADAVPTIERRRDTQALGSLANTNGEIGADTDPPGLLRASTPAPPIVERPREPAAPSPIAATPTRTAPTIPAPPPARLTPLTSTVEQSAPRSLEPVVDEEAASSQSRTPAPDPLPLVTVSPTLDGALSPIRTAPGWKDPLGVQARARIERLSTAPVARESAPALPPVPIELTIGRLEIRADSKPAPRAAKPFAPHLDLAAYRSRRDRGV